MYDTAYFDAHEPGARRSAEAVMPLLLEHTGARSVIDVGCGAGVWLAVARERGVGRILGVDGPYIERAALRIPDESFVAAELTRPLGDLGSFDLAISLEVAEHLPPERAESFVADLVALAPAVAFSAAIPDQGGVGHINEQWPDYWHALFAKHGYAALDVVRPRVWDRMGIDPWYAQNTFLYVRDAEPQNGLPVRIIHPDLFQTRIGLLRREIATTTWVRRTRANVQLRGRLRRLLERA